jgi:hypothetical protein
VAQKSKTICLVSLDGRFCQTGLDGTAASPFHDLDVVVSHASIQGMAGEFNLRSPLVSSTADGSEKLLISDRRSQSIVIFSLFGNLAQPELAYKCSAASLGPINFFKADSEMAWLLGGDTAGSLAIWRLNQPECDTFITHQ